MEGCLKFMSSKAAASFIPGAVIVGLYVFIGPILLFVGPDDPKASFTRLEMLLATLPIVVGIALRQAIMERQIARLSGKEDRIGSA